MTDTTTRLGGIVGISLALSGCGTLYKLDVTAYNNPGIELDRTYVVLSGHPDLDVKSAEFEVFARQVELVLAEKGYRRVTGQDLSNVALGVYLSADVSDPSKRYHSVTTGLYETPYDENPTSVVRASGQGSGGQSSGANLPPPPPPERLAGYEELGFATTIFTKQLSLVAVDLQQYLHDLSSSGREKAVPREVWSIDIETTGQPSELGEVVPVMLAAGEPYIAVSTPQVVHVRINGNDRRIARIRSAE